MEESQSVLPNIEVVAKNLAKDNGLLVGLISKLRSKTSVATNAIKMKAEEQPDRFEAADPEETSRDTIEPRADLGSGEVWEVFGATGS